MSIDAQCAVQRRQQGCREAGSWPGPEPTWRTPTKRQRRWPAQRTGPTTSSLAGLNLDVEEELGTAALARHRIYAPLQLLATGAQQTSAACRTGLRLRSHRDEQECRCRPVDRFAKPCRMTSTRRHIPVSHRTVMLNITPAALKLPLHAHNIRRT